MGWVATGFEFESGGLGNVWCCDGGWGDKAKDILALVRLTGRISSVKLRWGMESRLMVF